MCRVWCKKYRNVQGDLCVHSIQPRHELSYHLSKIPSYEILIKNKPFQTQCTLKMRYIRWPQLRGFIRINVNDLLKLMLCDQESQVASLGVFSQLLFGKLTIRSYCSGIQCNYLRLLLPPPYTHL